MRCARCDHLAIPQAVGRLPDGRIVFGWCLDCMEEEQCSRVTVAHETRALRRWLARRPSTSAERRAHALAIIAVVLGVWAAVLLVIGTLRLPRSSTLPLDPRSYQAANVLIPAGAALGLAGLMLGAIAMTRAEWFWRLLEWLLFACALLVLMLGVVHHDPKRAPWLVVVAGFAFALSGLVHQRRRLHAYHPRSVHRAPSPDPTLDPGEDCESL